MARVALICFTKSGIRQIRISITKETMDKPQAHPVSGPKMAPYTVWNWTMTHETGVVMKLKRLAIVSTNHAPWAWDEVSAAGLEGGFPSVAGSAAEDPPLRARQVPRSISCHRGRLRGGTWSTPPSDHGLHRRMRQAVSAVPLIAPCRSMAWKP